MWWDRQRPWVVLLAPATAALVMIGYFALFDRWTHLENPIQSQLAPAAGIIGALTAIGVQRIRNWWLVLLPGLAAVLVLAFALLIPTESAENRELRNIMWVLFCLMVVSIGAVNLPQIVRGRHK